MNINRRIGTILSMCLILGLFVLCSSCGSDDTEKPKKKSSNIPKDFTVRVLIKANCDGLNKVVSRSAISGEILDNNVNARLLEVDPATFELRPYLAKERPHVKVMENGSMELTFEIREEAVWDDGTPITAADYVFTVKAIKNPKVNAAPIRPFLEIISDVKIDPNNPKKFTVFCNEPYMDAESVLGAVFDIYPAYFYDAQGLMTDFTVAELSDAANFDRLTQDTRIRDFAEDFNNNYNLNPEKVVGAGPYQVKEIETNQYILLERKKDWWGDKVDVDYIAAYPEKIMFRIIAEDNNAMMLLKEQELDVMTYIPADRFLEIKEDERVTSIFELHANDGFAYRYIGMNMRRPKLADVRVRKALAHLIDTKVVAEELANGLATPVVGPVNPQKKHYNKNIPGIEFNIEKAKALLAEAGWADTDGDNILDKVIEGKKEKMTLKYLYPQGIQFYKDLAQIFKDEATRIGVEIEMASTEWSVMIEDMNARNFDLACMGWGSAPGLDDFKQIWHTSSIANEGSNMVGFGNEETDKLIETIRETVDEAKRNEMYLRFQEIVAAEQPYIFLVSPKMCTAISKRFKNAPATAMRPGYWVRLFQLKEAKAE